MKRTTSLFSGLILGRYEDFEERRLGVALGKVRAGLLMVEEELRRLEQGAGQDAGDS